jgi:hypothetical protein
MTDRDDKPRPPVSMIPDYPFRGRTQHDANLAATRASAAATYWKRVAQEAETRVQQLESAIADHRAAIRVIGEDPDPLRCDQRLWAVLGEEALDD